MALRQAAALRLQAWAARRHGPDNLPVKISRRRIYILPTRFGLMLAVILTAMLIAGLNYNSNLALAFAFLMVSAALVTMHHCNRNLVNLGVDVARAADTFAGREAVFEFVLRNDSGIERRDIDILCQSSSATGSVRARDSDSITVRVPAPRRGVIRMQRFELRTRYPFGWFHAWTYVHASLAMYVAPTPAGSHSLPSVGSRGAAAHAEIRGDEDFAGLRTYEPGIPLKHMAWKVIARGGEAAVRSYTSLGAQPEWLEWNLLEGMSDEARLSQLALWIIESEQAQRLYGLRVPGFEVAPSAGAAHRTACLRTLAQFGLGVGVEKF